MSTGPKGEWGGRRPNQTGRPRAFNSSDRQVRNMLREAKKIAKEEGKTLDRLLLEIAYDKEYVVIKKRNGELLELPAVEPKTRVAAIKVFKEFTIHRVSEQNKTIKDERPAMRLPEMKPDPGKVFVKEGNA